MFGFLALLVAALVGATPGGSALRPVSIVAADQLIDVRAPVVDLLTDGDVLRVTVTNWHGGSSATVSQCVRQPNGFDDCRNSFPVLFDDEGTAVFQYQLVDDGRCGPAGRCVLRVEDPDGVKHAHASLVFGGPAPDPPDVRVDPLGPYAPGAEVVVMVGPLAPATPVVAAFCSPGCEAVETVAGADGQAKVTVVLGDRCRDCGIRVVAGPSDRLLPVTFTAAPSPQNSIGRLSAGLALAAGLLVAAWLVFLRVDWRPPSEAATPEFD